MGGNALKEYPTERKSAEDYFALTDEFAIKFNARFGFWPVLIQAYLEKADFGDADFLIKSEYLPPNWIDILKDEFELNKNQIVRNSDVTSIGWKNFQFDLIKTNDLNAAMFYFSYNDLGNLLGRLTKKLGVKFGHEGLSMIIRHKDRGDHVLKEIKITSEPAEILELIGLSITKYLDGFNTLEDIYEFVISSKWFNRDIYLFENRNSINRRRDKKRSTYNGFLKYIDEHQSENKHVFKQKTELGGYSIVMPYYEAEILPRWPWLKPVVDKIIADFELELQFKAVYNGNIVAEHTGYSGKILGAFMTKMKERITPEVMKLWVERPHLVDLNIANLFLEVGGITFMQDSVLLQDSIV